MRHINLNFLTLFLSAIAGGLATSLLIPFVSYFFKGILTKRLVKVEIETPIFNNTTGYIIFPLRIKNKSFGSLKNVVSFVILDYAKEDIVVDNPIRTYTVDTSNQPMMLSWAKVVNDCNAPNMDINQGESADLNLIRYHQNQPLPLIQFASEQGFWNPDWNNKGRLLLKSHKDYFFKILITTDNMWPIRRKFKFSHSAADLLESK